MRSYLTWTLSCGFVDNGKWVWSTADADRVFGFSALHCLDHPSPSLARASGPFPTLCRKAELVGPKWAITIHLIPFSPLPQRRWLLHCAPYSVHEDRSVSILLSDQCLGRQQNGLRALKLEAHPSNLGRRAIHRVIRHDQPNSLTKLTLSDRPLPLRV